MDLFEDEILSSDFSRLSSHIYHWYRYVDDILCAWSGSLVQLHDFLDFMISQYPSIEFTSEIGDAHNTAADHFNFLDHSILINDEFKHEFGILRKEAHTDLVILGDSFHPPKKMQSSTV